MPNGCRNDAQNVNITSLWKWRWLLIEYSEIHAEIINRFTGFCLTCLENINKKSGYNCVNFQTISKAEIKVLHYNWVYTFCTRVRSVEFTKLIGMIYTSSIILQIYKCEYVRGINIRIRGTQIPNFLNNVLGSSYFQRIYEIWRRLWLWISHTIMWEKCGLHHVRSYKIKSTQFLGPTLLQFAM